MLVPLCVRVCLCAFFCVCVCAWNRGPRTQDRLSRAGGFHTFPSRLLQVVELLTTARVAEKALQRAADPPTASPAASPRASCAGGAPALLTAGGDGPLVPAPEVTLPDKEDAASVARQSLQVQRAGVCWWLLRTCPLAAAVASPRATQRPIACLLL